ncbi:MAG: hypothetical protein B6247_07790, partial [Candidatus Parabeggiatoa sp. nov. 2]
EKTLVTRFEIPFVVQRDSHIVSRYVSHFSTSITVVRQLGLGSEKTLVTRFETKKRWLLGLKSLLLSNGTVISLAGTLAIFQRLSRWPAN